MALVTIRVQAESSNIEWLEYCQENSIYCIKMELPLLLRKHFFYLLSFMPCLSPTSYFTLSIILISCSFLTGAIGWKFSLGKCFVYCTRIDFCNVLMLYWWSNYILVIETLEKRHAPQMFKACKVHREGQCSKVTQFKVLPNPLYTSGGLPSFCRPQVWFLPSSSSYCSPSQSCTLRSLCLTLSQQNHKLPWSLWRTWRLPKYQQHFLYIVMNPEELQWPDSAIPHRNESIVCSTK